MKYLVHCTNKEDLRKILSEKIIKTAKSQDKETSVRGKYDVTYFSFLLNNKYITTWKPKEVDPRWQYCIVLKIRDIVGRYKYFYMSSVWNYGEVMEKISSRLHKMVQSSKNVNDLRKKILSDKNMSEQCRNSLIGSERLQQLFEFKGKKNKSIMEMVKEARERYYGNDRTFFNLEICFFDNIEIRNIYHKVIKNITPLKST